MESENLVNQVYLVALKGRKIESCENRNRGNQGMPVYLIELMFLGKSYILFRMLLQNEFDPIVQGSSPNDGSFQWLNAPVKENYQEKCTRAG